MHNKRKRQFSAASITCAVRNIVVIFILSASSFVVASDYSWNISIHNNQWAALLHTHPGGVSLIEAVNAVPKNTWLRSFRVFLSENDHVLQKEIHEFLRLNYPELHEAALNSVGNMHNPKVIALREPFKQAILASSLVKKFDTALASRCERIVSTSYEKFMIWKQNGQPIYSAMVWLSTEKCI